MLIHSSLSVCLVEHVRCISTLGWKSKWEQDEFSHSIRLTVTERVSAIWEGCKSRHPREDLLLYFLHSSCCVTLCLTKAAIRLIDTSWLREKTLACSSVCFLLVDSCCCCWLFFFFLVLLCLSTRTPSRGIAVVVFCASLLWQVSDWVRWISEAVETDAVILILLLSCTSFFSFFLCVCVLFRSVIELLLDFTTTWQRHSLKDRQKYTAPSFFKAHYSHICKCWGVIVIMRCRFQKQQIWGGH